MRENGSMSESSITSIGDVGGLLAAEFSSVRSVSELHQTTVDLAADLFGADLCFIAETDDCGLEVIASKPSDWTGTDGLLSPVSLPSLCAMQGDAQVVEDRSDVRSAADTEPGVTTVSPRYRSILVAPFGNGEVLLVGDEEPASFADSDVDTVRLICRFVTSLRAEIESGSDHTFDPDGMRDAIATLSHDASNFLSIIQGRVVLARDDPQPEHFDSIERAVTRLDDLLGDTKTLVTTGQHVSDVEPVDLEDTVRRAWLTTPTEDATLRTNQLVPIVAEESRLNQLLENLFRNAIEHAGPACRVRVGMLPDEQGFYVEDDGPGIGSGKQAEVFDVGYSGSGRGSGLGLSIVRRIANAHEWDVRVADGEIDGARFEITSVETTL